MATTSIWKVRGSVGKVVRYAENPEKTSIEDTLGDAEGGLDDVIRYAAQPAKTDCRQLVSGINCVPETAAEEMRATKAQYGKEGGIVAFHGYQSFAPGEADPRTAHEIGVALATRLWADRFEVVVATHTDRDHIHNHFVINSVSFADGLRFHRDAACYRAMREASDRLCAERGLSVVEGGAPGRSQHYSERADAKSGKQTWRSLVKADVDEAIAHAATERQLWSNLAALGYEVKRGKERFVRLARNFGEGYTAEGIRRRILENRRPQAPAVHRRSSSSPARRHPAPRGSLMALYRQWMYLLGAYRKGTARPHFLIREDVRHMERIGEEMRLLAREGIETSSQLSAYASSTTERIGALCAERNELRRAARRCGRAPDGTRMKEIADELKRLRKEVRMCASIQERSMSLPERIAEVRAGEGEKEKGDVNGNRVAGGRADREDDPRRERDAREAHGGRR